MPQPSALDRFLDLLRTAVADGTLVKFTLGKYRGIDPTLRNLFVRPVALKTGPHLAFLWRHATRDVTKNHLPGAALVALEPLLDHDFLDAHLFTTAQNAQLECQPDGTARLSRNGEPMRHFMGTSTFAEYTVMPEIALAKVNPEAPLDGCAPFACGLSTGIGAALYTAEVERGSTAVVFGCGLVGLGAVIGARLAGAERIIAIDLAEGRLADARHHGATETRLAGPDTVDWIKEQTGGYGADYTFEATGNVNVMRQAVESAREAWGLATMCGVAGKGEVLEIVPRFLITGRRVTGSSFGGVKGRTQVPLLVDRWLNGDIDVESMLSHRITLDEVNHGFELMERQDGIRSIITFGSA